MENRRIKAIVQYDGTGYSGFQRQKNAMSVQEKLEGALSRLLKHKVVVRAAGRTDKGVHARGQVIVFDTFSTIPAEVFPDALIGYLPEDISVVDTQAVPMSFDPMKDSVSKTYCYRIWRNRAQDIFWKRFTTWYCGELDFEAMVNESARFLGEHDFSNFSVKSSSVKTTVRKVLDARWEKGDDLWEFYITGSGFLYKMVRLIAGTLIDVGRGRFPQGTVENALKEFPHQVGKCASPKGLCLEEVQFS